MQIVRNYVFIAGIAAVGLALVSRSMLSADKESFFGNLLLNVVAEFVGIGIGLFVGFKIASRLADEKLRTLAPRIVALIKQLRADGALSSLAARASVVCAVGLIAEDRLGTSRGAEQPQTAPCPVCQLAYQTEDHAGEGKRCSYCKLPGAVWNIAAGS